MPRLPAEMVEALELPITAEELYAILTKDKKLH